ncbi:MAG: hypothetical protein GWN09_08075 [Gammaproteobacteria bacterium]|nr:hypothetical protein [Gammaproteobacteria bacterium]
MRQGFVGYEGDMPDARPLPQRSLRQHAEDLEASLRGSQLSGKPIHPDALYFTFYAGTAPENEPEAIVISKRDFWCLSRHGATVLLSDGVNHHTTGVFSVNRKDQAIYILDLWPERFFMLEGRNARGYTAQLFDFEHPLLRPFVQALLQGEEVLKEDFTRKLVKVDKKQYLKVIAGLVTLDTPEFIDYFFSINSTAAEDARTQLAFGLTLLHWGNNRFVDEAVEHVEKALELAQQTGNEKVERTAVNRLNLALLLEYYFARERGDVAAAEAKQNRRKRLSQRYGEERLVADNAAIDYYRLGSAAGHAGDFDNAIVFFTHAIEKKPDYQVAYLDRAVAKARKLDANGVVEDASKALELNVLERKALAAQRAERHPRDKMGRLRDSGREHYLNEWEALALRVRGTSLQSLRQYDRALRDGQRLVELEPDNPKGYALVGFSLLGKGETSKARASLEQAAARETEPQSLSMIMAAVNELGAPSEEDFFHQYRQAMLANDREAAQSLVDTYPGTARVVASNLVAQGQGALKALDLDGALGAYSVCLNLLEQIGDELNVGLVLNDMAVAHLLKGELHAALAAVRRANYIFRRHHNVDGERASADTLNRLFNRFGTEAEVEAFLEEHLVYAREHGLEEEFDLTSTQLERLRSD